MGFYFQHFYREWMKDHNEGVSTFYLFNYKISDEV